MNILSIDGGGIRGLIPARIVEELERRIGTNLARVFDLVIGTSTGALVAAALAAPAADGGLRPAAEIPAIYRSHGNRIFPMGKRNLTTKERLLGRKDMRFGEEMLATAQRIGSVFGGNPRFDGGARHMSSGVEGVLAEFFGEVALSECVTGIRITSFDQAAGTAVLFSEADDVPVRDALRASIAAPTYLAPHAHGERSLIDGGVWANNPALVALPELMADARSVLVSLGTGHRHTPVPVGPAIGRNWAQQASGMMSMVTEGETTDFLLRRALGEGRYLRLQVDLPSGIAMDDPSSTNLDRLDQTAHDLIRAESTTIDAVADLVRGRD